MKEASVDLQPKKRRQTRHFLSNAIVSLIFFYILYSLGNLWHNGSISASTMSSLLTFVGGLFIFITGQIVLKSYIEPLQEFQKTIGEIGSAILVFSNCFNSTISDASAQEAIVALRKLSGDIQGKRRVIPHYVFFEKMGIVPSSSDISMVSVCLVEISNEVGISDSEIFESHKQTIKTSLWLDY